MNAKNIIKRLRSNGFEAYLVGGVVRDQLMNKPSNDEDVACNATPEEISIIFSDSKIDLVGQQFLVTIVDGIEVATYRKDIYGVNSVDPEVNRCETIEADLSRRDFTINAMAYCPIDNVIIDPLGGQDDLQQGTVRFVGNPEKRILEDPCRILRGCRMAAIISGHIDSKSLAAMKAYKTLVKSIPPERIRLEILKAMKTPYPGIFIEYLKTVGILGYIFPALNNTVGVSGGKYHKETIYAHSIIVGNMLSPSRKTADHAGLIRLAGFLHDIGKPDASADGSFISHEKIGAKLVEKELKNLKFTNFEIKCISSLVLLHMTNCMRLSDKGVRRVIVKLNQSNIWYRDLLKLNIADQKGNLRSINYTIVEIKKLITTIENELIRPKVVSKLSLLAINGRDVMRITGLPPGIKIGEILNNIFDIVVDDPSKNTKSQITNILTNLVN